MFVHTFNTLNLLIPSKRLVIAIVVAAVVVVAVLALSTGVAFAGPGTSGSACGTCAG